MLSKFSSFVLLATLLAGGCTTHNQPTNDTPPEDCGAAIYHWKGEFKPDSTELNFLKQHHIKRLYLKMFDVVDHWDNLSHQIDIRPNATTKFSCRPPADVEVIPVTYITIDALREMHTREGEYAPLIVERLLAMARHNHCGTIREVQLDCDWTSTTKASYHKLCRIVKDSLNARNIDLSITIRLHQLQETPPPADRGVLMLYNTGALKDPKTHNSILDIDDVKPYLKVSTYPLPLDYAYPAFGWGVKFVDDYFWMIVSEQAQAHDDKTHIRRERPSAKEILRTKALVEQRLGKPNRGNILYHLDKQQLNHYNNDEISEILAY